ncbi:MAG: decarboxylating 6-phosphogluconate dehydrogenase [Candidatus Eisenbacteria bacterium]|uniref:Decarboxylating 6-phosphogluconate dehydrogenase n=1 Tax=Eiseniibacteriota bacterium TaxID=2212470 RepID=A0A538TKD4_UNCEI|nr:MAG: decarboxylating 6-phosphogluconate dehydrogenase [Candidatus Eisenbacteria bacterium]TMQ64081.1 MAG: decarboxylating 6-phosphogluconate dehydrogenase [Candidatus Eisenbacteria bacterium]
MELGFIGLGRMGKNMVLRLLDGGHRIVAWDRSRDPIQEVSGKGAVAASNLSELVAKLGDTPRAVWVMVPSGDPTEQVIRDVAPLLKAGDAIIDGGNSYYKDSVRRASWLAEKRIDFVDAGTSGGIWGLSRGYCLMVGGSEAVCRRLEPLFQTLAPKDGYARVGASGAGHFTKMVHNGIEYGLMQAYAEGFEILKASPYDLDLRSIAALWNHGSVVRSWLLELAESAFEDDPNLEHVRGYVEDSGEGRWTVMESIEQAVPAPVLMLALQTRFRSRQSDSFQGKVLAALRHKFGGHAVKTS